MNRSERLALVDHDDPVLPVVAQCRLLKVARSTLYYRPAPVSADDLAVMRRIDELHLSWPFYGSRRMAAVLRREGWAVNRKAGDGHRGDLPETQHQQGPPGTPGLSIFVARPDDRPAEPGVVRRHHIYPDGQGVCLSGGGDGLVQPAGPGVAVVDSISNSFGTAVISLDFASVAIWPSTMRCSQPHALTMCKASSPRACLTCRGVESISLEPGKRESAVKLIRSASPLPGSQGCEPNLCAQAAAIGDTSDRLRLAASAAQ